jgi:hypothetical protein
MPRVSKATQFANILKRLRKVSVEAFEMDLSVTLVPAGDAIEKKCNCRDWEMNLLSHAAREKPCPKHGEDRVEGGD